MRDEKKAKEIYREVVSEDGRRVTKVGQEIDDETQFLETPFGTKVSAGSIVIAAEEYISLNPEEREIEKSVWMDLFATLLKIDKKRFKDIEIKGEHEILFICTDE